jgi:hypothetical protein
MVVHGCLWLFMVGLRPVTLDNDFFFLITNWLNADAIFGGKYFDHRPLSLYHLRDTYVSATVALGQQCNRKPDIWLFEIKSIISLYLCTHVCISVFVYICEEDPFV